MIRRAARFLFQALLTAALACAPCARADPGGDEAGRPVFRNFRPTEYRGHPQVYGVATAPNGLVYLSSEQGIIEYDGIRWRHLPAPVSMVFALQAATDGRIWMGGMDEVGYYAAGTPGGGLGYHSVTAALPADQRQVGRLRSLLVRPDGVFFSSRGLIFRWRDGAVRVWKIGARAPRLHSVGETLYAHVGGTGLLRLAGDEFAPVCPAPAFAATNESVLLPAGPAQLLAIIPGEGFFELDPATGRLTPWATPADALIRAVKTAVGVRLHDGAIAVGTQPLGLLVISADGTRVRRLDRTAGLVDNVVLSLAPDPAGGLWVGFNTGAARVELDSPVSVFDGDNGPPSGTIDCWGRHEGALYAGAFDGLWRLLPADPTTGTGARFVKDPRPLTNVFALEPLDGETLVAAFGGLHRLTADGAERLIDTGANNADLCMVVSRVTPGRVYLGTSLGLTVAQKTPAGWVRLADYADLGDVHTAAEEADGTLWLATYSRGFWQIPHAARLTDWSGTQPRQFFKNCGLPENINWTAVFAAPGGASLFTDKGSYRLAAGGARCVPEDRFTLPGEPRAAIYPLVLAANGDGWASVYTASTLETDYPIGRFTAASHHTVWQPAPAAALAEIGFAGAAVMALDRTPAGEEVIWARGYSNTVRLALGRAAPAPAAWRAVIRSLTADGRAQPLPAAGAALRLPFSREPIAFTLAAPSFGAGGDVRFSTRLVGYSDKWSAPSARAEVAFTNLAGGPFTLEVRAHDAEGRVSAPATLIFSVAPPWPRSPAAYALYAVALAAGVLAFVRWRLGRAERERRRLEALVATRTAELAAARDAAEAASRAKSAFLASMSHELRTPLNGVLGYAQLLQADPRLAPDQRERLRIVHTSGEHLLRMINDVLDLAKIEAGKLTLRPAPFALGDLLRDITAAHAPAAAAKKLAFNTDISPALPAWVQGDAQKLRQILDNLLGNAVKFTVNGGVTLRVHLVGGVPPPRGDVTRGEGTPPTPEIAFSVADTGPGISAADQRRLFQPFEQAGDPAQTNAPGTGLGLAIARALVERFGGTLTLASEPGRGSEFGFTIPLPAVAPAAALSSAGQHLAGYEGPPRRVLVVDDHAVNRRLLGDLLAPLGFDCAEASSAAEALARLEAGSEPWPDAAIVDLRMPGIDGLELTRRLRALPRGPGLKILLTSASVIAFDPADATRAGCDDFLPKPFRTADLLEKLGRLLALQWRAADSAPPFAAAQPAAPIPDDARAELREHLAHGDLAAFRAVLARARLAHPAAEPLWQELDTAAAAFQLPRLRQLLGEP